MTTSTEQDDPLLAQRFDLIIRLPDPADTDALQQAARARLGLNHAKAEQLLQHLLSHGASRVRRSVSREEAEQAAAGFRAAGFDTELKAVLSLLSKDAALADSECPGCKRMMRPTPQRQCPYCFIYLDKIDPEKLRQKQIRDEEQRKLNARLQREGELASRQQQEDSERALRNRIRAELEREMGLHRPWLAFFRGGRGALRAAAIVALLGASFWAGHRLGTLPRALAAGLPQGLGGVMQAGLGGEPLDIERFAASPAGAALVAGSGDSLLQPGATPAGAEWQMVAASVQKERSSQGAVLGEKQRLTLALVVALAQAGQAQRATELLAQLQASPGYQAELAQADNMLATIWLLVQRPGGMTQAALDEQLALLTKLPAQQAAPLAARIAAILAGNAAMAPASWQAWLDTADKSWQSLPAGLMRDYAGSQVQRWRGQAWLNALQANAAKGRWQAARQQGEALQQWRAANPGLVSLALGLQAATVLGEVGPAEAFRQQLSSEALQAARSGDASLQLQQLADHVGDIDLSALLPQLAAVVPAQAANLQPLLYGNLALLAATSGQAAAAAQFQQQAASGLAEGDGRDGRILALSVDCTTRLARYYQQSRQPALAEQQLRKAAAVVVPLLPQAAPTS